MKMFYLFVLAALMVGAYEVKKVPSTAPPNLSMGTEASGNKANFVYDCRTVDCTSVGVETTSKPDIKIAGAAVKNSRRVLLETGRVAVFLCYDDSKGSFVDTGECSYNASSQKGERRGDAPLHAALIVSYI